MWVWYSAGHQCSLTRPNKHNHSSGPHKEHSVSTLVPQLWLPTQVQGNGNEKLKKEPQEWGWGGCGWGWTVRISSPWVLHNGMFTEIFMHIFSPWCCTYPLINGHFSGFWVMENGLFLSQTESVPTSRSSSDLARLRRFAERRLEARIPPIPQNLEPC